MKIAEYREYLKYRKQLDEFGAKTKRELELINSTTKRINSEYQRSKSRPTEY